MVSKEEIKKAYDKMILSASGWRGIFARDGDDESKTEEISAAHQFISGAAALVFAEYLKSRSNQNLDSNPQFPTSTSTPNPQFCILNSPFSILLGTDTRPTCKAIINSMIPVLLGSGCAVQYAGITAAPEIMAWARTKIPDTPCGFIYISASHNPVGYNGIKFGLTDGGVLKADEANLLINNFRSFFDKDNYIQKIETLFSAADKNLIDKVFADIPFFKKEAFNAYYDFCGQVVFGGNNAIETALIEGLRKYPLGIVCDFNGSARTVSVDKDYFSAFGIKFEFFNGEPGQIAHRIVPEGESLDPCCVFLEEAHKRDPSYIMGYVPDCDGDRGNLVIWDASLRKTRSLEAQEVFALAVIAELSHLVWTGELQVAKTAVAKTAVAANDPTSMIINRIAEAFGVSVFRAEVGEANVVSLAQNLREKNYIVRILGEGSAGGNITYPSAVRDPLHTVMAIAKMLAIRSAGSSGLFEIWCQVSGQIDKYRDDFSLTDIISSLPLFSSTPTYHKDAIMSINTQDHALLKDRYQKIFIREWEQQKDELKVRFGFSSWEAIAYNGITETRNLEQFAIAKKGGLKILFMNDADKEIAFIWMRGSATEPVFRIMADVDLSAVNDKNAERFLLDWQRTMIMEADSNEQ